MTFITPHQATIGGFAKAGMTASEGERLLRKSVELAMSARDAAWALIQADTSCPPKRCRPLVAASVGCYG